MSHPSHLALDRYALGATPELASHVEHCDVCRAQVAAVQVSLPTPAWLKDVERAPRPRWRWPALVLVAVAAAALVVLVVPRTNDDVRPKGTPAATLWLKRGEAVSAWSGAPVRAGDAVRFEVAPAGYRHLTVVQLTPTPHVLYAAQLDTTQATTLTPTWSLDDERTDEHLALVLTRDPLRDADLTRAVGRRDADTYSLTFRLPRAHP